MKITRRNFVQSLGTATAITVSGTGLETAFGVTNTPNQSSTKLAADGLLAMKEADVRRFVGRTFVVTSAEGKATEVTLTDVVTIGRTENSKRGYSGECFSAIFKSRPKRMIGQGIYSIKGAGLETSSALLVPTGRRQLEFEMIVNRITR